MTAIQHIPNPFIVGNPIKSRSMFYGREDDFEFLRTKLGTGKNSHIIVVCGERRSGKTSILFQILNGALGSDYLPVLIDMQTMAALRNDTEFFERFALETLKSLPQGLLSSQQYDFASGKTSPYKVFDNLLDDIHISFPYQKILFLIDEFELIDAKIEEGSLNPNFVRFLSGILESERNISFILTGSQRLEERDNTVWKSLFGKALYRNMSFLSHGDTCRLVSEPIQEWVTVDDPVLDHIYQLTSGQPFYTQVVCQNLIDLLNERRRNEVHPGDVDRVVEEILENPLPQMLYFWNSLSANQKLLLSLVCELLDNDYAQVSADQVLRSSRKREYGIRTDLHTINTTLEGLYHARILAKKEGNYAMQMDLFRLWIRQEHSIWRTLKEAGPYLLTPNSEGENHQDSAVSLASKARDWSDRLIRFSHWYLPEMVHRIPHLRKGVLIAVAAAIPLTAMVLWPGENPPPPHSADIRAAESDTTTLRLASLASEPSTPESLMTTFFYLPPDTISDSFPDDDAPEDIILPVHSQVVRKDARGAEEPQQTRTYRKQVRNFPQTHFAASARKAMQTMKQNRQKALPFMKQPVVLELVRDAEKTDIQAFALFNRGQYRDSERYFEKASELYGKIGEHGDELTNRLRSEAQMLQYSLDRLNPEFSKEYQNIEAYQKAQDAENSGNVLLASGDHAEAIKYYKNAMELYQSAQLHHQNRTEAVRELIFEFGKALESEDLNRLAELHIRLPRDRYQTWQDFFRKVSELTVLVQIKSIHFPGNYARAEVSAQLNY
nr:AAA family ATPase [Calditrichia bacterium]